MKKTTALAALFGAAALQLFSAAPAQAAVVNLLNNGNFEASAMVSGYGYCYAGVSGCQANAWTSNSQVVVIQAANPSWGNPASLGGNQGAGLGTLIAGIQGDGATLSQAVSAGAGLFNYTLNWYDAGRSGYAGNSYSVYFDGVLLGSYSTASGQAWAQHTLSFTGVGNGTLTFTNQVVAGDHTSFLDQVSLSGSAASVPEPTTLSIVGAGLLAALAVRRRRA